MATDSIIDPNLPPEVAAEQQSIVRRRRLAEAMMQRGMTPIQSTNPRSPVSWTQGLAQIANAYYGAQAGNEADQQSAALGQRYQQGLADEVRRLAAMRQGTPASTENIVDEQANGGEGAPAQINAPAVAGNPKGAIEAALLSQYAPVRQMGVLEHKTYENEQTRANDREARLQERILALDAKAADDKGRAEDRKAAADQAASLRREIATMQDTTRRDIAAQSDATRRDVATAAGKPPTGYRTKPDGSLEAIPGGPADTKLQGQYNVDTASLQGNLAALDRLAAQVKLTQDSQLGRTTGLMGMLPNVPGQPGAVAQSRLDALKSQVGFSVLQELRNTAKNGSSGLGQVTEREHAMLQQQMGNLEKAQGEDEIRRVLADIAKFTEASKERIRAAYNMKHGEKAPAQAPGAAPGQPRVVDW